MVEDCVTLAHCATVMPHAWALCPNQHSDVVSRLSESGHARVDIVYMADQCLLKLTGIMHDRLVEFGGSSLYVPGVT